MESEPRTRVVLVGDDRLLGTGLRMLLTSHGIGVAGKATNAAEARQMIAEHNPDVVVADMAITSGDCPYSLVAESAQTTPVVALSGSAYERIFTRIMDANASGFVLKQSGSLMLVDAVRKVASGGRWIDPQAAQPEGTGTIKILSNREREILEQISLGQSTDDVASDFCISTHTVRTHVKNAMRKLDATTRGHAIAIAMREHSFR